MEMLFILVRRAVTELLKKLEEKIIYFGYRVIRFNRKILPLFFLDCTFCVCLNLFCLSVRSSAKSTLYPNEHNIPNNVYVIISARNRNADCRPVSRVFGSKTATRYSITSFRVKLQSRSRVETIRKVKRKILSK